MSTRLLTGWVVAGLIGLATAYWVPHADAQGLEQQIVSLSVTGQSSFVPADGSFVIEVEITPTNLLAQSSREPDEKSPFELGITVFDRVEDEGELDGTPATALSRLEAVNLDDLVPSQPGRYRLEIPIRSASAFDQDNRVPLPEAGVYPVTVELRNEDGVISSARTNLIRLGVETSESNQQTTTNSSGDTIPISIVLPIEVKVDKPQTTQDNAEQDAGSSAALQAGLTLGAAEQLLSLHPNLPLTVTISPAVITRLESDAKLAESFANAVGERTVVARPEVDLDVSALAEIGQSDIFGRSIDESRARAEAVGLTPAEDVVALGSSVTEAGAQALHDLGIKIVLDAGGNSTSTAEGTTRLGYLQLEDTSGPSSRVHLLAFDDELGAILTEDKTVPVQASRLMSKLTVRGQTNSAPVVIGGASLGPQPASALNVFFRWLTRPGAPRPVNLDAVIASTPLRAPAEQPSQNLEQVGGVIGDIQQILVGYEAMYAGGGTSPDDYSSSLRDTLGLHHNSTDRHRTLLAFSETLAQELEAISLPDAQPVTMAARAGAIPLVIESRAAGPRLVMLRFRSDKVQVAEDSKLVVVEPGVTSIDVEVQARTLGASQLEVSVRTPDGQRVLAVNQFQVRSTAVPGLGLLISILAATSLLGWWFLDHRKSKAKSESKLESESLDLTDDSAKESEEVVLDVTERDTTQVGVANEISLQIRSPKPKTMPTETGERAETGATK